MRITRYRVQNSEAPLLNRCPSVRLEGVRCKGDRDGGDHPACTARRNEMEEGRGNRPGGASAIPCTEPGGSAPKQLARRTTTKMPCMQMAVRVLSASRRSPLVGSDLDLSRPREEGRKLDL